jgi:lipopolysaccharide transport system ATP-binding protein
MSDLALSVRNLSKTYTIRHEQRESTFTETLLKRAKNGFRSATQESFYALKDVSFDVKKGDVVGIIGRNGAGKSTLLKILSRITEPTTGQIDLYGRVGSLLEVGTGFHPELTGRENIFLNGAILGMKKSEIKKQFDAIVDFAGVEKFLDTPVKRYSSGMYVRLAFAVAAHLESEILIVDEVLAVGDAEFQKKCLGKMKDVSDQQGRTVLFVSHSMASILSNCSKGLLLADGKVVTFGDVKYATGLYLRFDRTNVPLTPQKFNPYGLRLGRCEIIDSNIGTSVATLIFSHDYELVVELISETEFQGAGISLIFRDNTGQVISSICPVAEGFGFIDIVKRQGLSSKWTSLPFLPGAYSLDVIVHRDKDSKEYLNVSNALSFTVEAGLLNGASHPYGSYHGYVWTKPNFSWL